MTCSARFTGILGLLLPWYVLAQSPVDSAASPVPPAPPPAVQAQPEMPVTVQVTGVETLKDYAAVSRLLGAAEGVRRVDVTEADGATVTFRVLVRGGNDTLDHALESSAQLMRSGVAGDRVIYEYRH